MNERFVVSYGGSASSICHHSPIVS